MGDDEGFLVGRDVEGDIEGLLDGLLVKGDSEGRVVEGDSEGLDVDGDRDGLEVEGEIDGVLEGLEVDGDTVGDPKGVGLNDPHVWSICLRKAKNLVLVPGLRILGVVAMSDALQKDEFVR
jgi:hypothetical protein